MIQGADHVARASGALSGLPAPASSGAGLPVGAVADLQDLVAAARTLQAGLVQDRRFLHAYPELGWEEQQTTAFVAERLRQLGYGVRVGRIFSAMHRG